jgi:hypothetical protein
MGTSTSTANYMGYFDNLVTDGTANEIAELKQTIAVLKDRVIALESRVARLNSDVVGLQHELAKRPYASPVTLGGYTNPPTTQWSSTYSPQTMTYQITADQLARSQAVMLNPKTGQLTGINY